MQLLILLLLLLLLDVEGSEQQQASPPIFVKVSQHRSQIRRSFVFPTRGFTERVDDVRLLGDAAVLADGSIRLPSSSSSSAGRALFASPVRMWDPNTSLPASFETEFTFAIDQPQQKLGLGGIAFVVAPDELTIGRGEGYMGMLSAAATQPPPSQRCNNSKKKKKTIQQVKNNLLQQQQPQQQHRPVLAIEFDAFKNEEFEDPNDNHVGVNLGSLVSSATADLADAGVDLHAGGNVTARVAFDGPTQLLTVQVARGWRVGVAEPLLTLQRADVEGLLREYMFVGFSAAGSPATLLSWRFACASHAVQRFPADILPNSDQCDEAELDHEFQQGNRTRRPPRAFVIFLAASAAAMLALTCVFIAWHHRRRAATAAAAAATREAAPPLILPRPRPLHRPRSFDLQELVVATSRFDATRTIGEGPRGRILRAALQDGSHVAVKCYHGDDGPASCLPLWRRGGGGGHEGAALDKEAFDAAMVALSGVRHANLLPLRGWCRLQGGSQRRRGGGAAATSPLLLVYDYMPNGSVDKWLYPGAAIATLPWSHRWKLAVDAASALAHLHACGFAHGSVKASNLLLDITFRARLGDYAVSAATGPKVNPAASELAKDVKGFGKLCLELVGGAPVKEQEQEQEQVVVDEKLGAAYDKEQAACLIGLGIACNHPQSGSQPSMADVLHFLKN